MTSLVLALLLSQARVQTPTLSPGAGSYGSAQTVTVATNTPGATIFCTTNGASPVSSGTRYTAPIAVSASQTVQCYARRNGYRPSLPVSAAYTISSGPDCVTAALRSTGTVYYYCDCGTGADANCVAGADTNAGTSPSAPRKTLSNAWSRFTGMNAGDTVALCRGGAWAFNGGSLENTNCTASSTCDLRDYVPSWGTSSTARPIITSAPYGPIVALTSPTPSGGYRFWNLDLRMPGTDGTIIFYYYAKHDIDICNVRFQESNLQINDDPNGTATQSSANITIRNSQFYLAAFSAFYGGHSGTVLDSNYFENNGINNTPQMHSIYLNGPLGGIWGPKIVNNYFTADSRCGGVMVVVHETVNDAEIANNWVQSISTNVNCYGIQSAGSLATAKLTNALVRRNRVKMASGTGIEVSACINCTVSDNVIVNGGLFLGTTYGGNTTISSGFTTQNNTIYNTTYDSGIWYGATVTGSVHENNVVWLGTGSSCFLPQGATFTRNSNNYCRTSGGASAASVFLDATNGNLKPALGSPLIGYGSSTYFSPTAIGSVTWSASDVGVSRAPPIDAGAFIH